MLKRILFTLVLLGLAVPATAQSENWSIWMYYPIEGKFDQIASDGSLLREVQLTTQAPEYEYFSYEAEVATNGKVLAYGETANPDGGDFPAEIVLYDPDAAAAYTRYPLNAQSEGVGGVHREGFNNATTSLTFNETADSVVFGYYFHTNPDDPDIHAWEIVAIDFMEPQPEAYSSLTSEEAALVLNLPEDAAFSIYIYQYANNIVTFALHPIFVEQGGETTMAAWNTVTDEVYKVDLPLVGNGDFQNGLILTPVRVETDPAATPSVEAPQAHTLELYDTSTNQSETIYSIDAGTLLAAKFIQNNERIAVLFYDSTTVNYELRILDLDGNLVGQIDNFLPGYWFSTPDGLLYIDGTALVHVNTRDAELTSTTVLEDTNGATGIYIQTISD